MAYSVCSPEQQAEPYAVRSEDRFEFALRSGALVEQSLPGSAARAAAALVGSGARQCSHHHLRRNSTFASGMDIRRSGPAQRLPCLGAVSYKPGTRTGRMGIRARLCRTTAACLARQLWGARQYIRRGLSQQCCRIHNYPGPVVSGWGSRNGPHLYGFRSKRSTDRNTQRTGAGVDPISGCSGRPHRYPWNLVG